MMPSSSEQPQPQSQQSLPGKRIKLGSKVPMSPSKGNEEDLLSPPFLSNIYYIQADDTFDDFLIDEPPSGCSGIKYTNTGTSRYIPPLPSVYGDASGCFMNVDESLPVEPLSLREKCLQPALGCDEMAVDRCTEFSNYSCIDDFDLGTEETTDHVDAHKKQCYCGPTLDEEDDCKKNEQLRSNCSDYYGPVAPLLVRFIWCGVLESLFAKEES